MRLSKLLMAIVFLSTAAQAQEYPVSGAWAYIDKNMPGMEVKACAAFVKFGIRKLSGNTVGEIVVFADGKRYDFGGYADTEGNNLSVQKLSDGSFEVTDRWYDDGEGASRVGFKKKVYVMKLIDPNTIEISDSASRGRYVKCGPKDDVATQTLAGMPHNRPCDIARIIPATSTQMGAMPSCLACVESLKTCRRGRDLIRIPS